MVLNGGDENSGALRVFFAALPVDAFDGEVVRFGAAGGEDNLGGVGSDDAGDAFAGVFDGGAGVASYGVQGGGVATVAHLFDHGVDGGGQYVGGGGVVEVDAAVLTVGFCAHGSSCWVVGRFSASLILSRSIRALLGVFTCGWVGERYSPGTLGSCSRAVCRLRGTLRSVFKILFYTPEIPGNTGNAIRLAAITGAELHLVKPLGFNFDDAHLRRAGLDYHDLAVVTVHETLEDAWEALTPERVFAFTTTASISYADIEYRPGDVFMFGPESVGLPAEVQQDPHVTERVKIPMKPGRRSLNLANSASIAVFEAWRQNGFEGGAI